MTQEFYDVSKEIEIIKAMISEIPDAAKRIGAMAQVSAQLSELMVWLGPYGERGRATREAMQVHRQPRGAEPNTVTVVADLSGLTPATIRRLAAIAPKVDAQ